MKSSIKKNSRDSSLNQTLNQRQEVHQISIDSSANPNLNLTTQSDLIEYTKSSFNHLL